MFSLGPGNGLSGVNYRSEMDDGMSFGTVLQLPHIEGHRKEKPNTHLRGFLACNQALTYIMYGIDLQFLFAFVETRS